MQLPLASGSLLQNRFRITQILGQGGFGRTYHALDEQRFNEQCAIKEYIPIQGNAYALEKSKQLFQREAETLYQIQHPQIPQFRALFEENARLFFVQDFIQGKTYSKLLQDRLTQGEAFSETEILHFLDRILPVLSYIHSQNLIHRDIAPDNIILRDCDHLPVLIDFGVVKLTELGQSLAPQSTVVGKSGYSPIEQLKTGKAYPSSDLYALAVTVLVLLTGKHPEYLFDEMTVSWRWSKYLPNLNPELARILEKMLSDRPQQRYQKADEVYAALAPIFNLNTLTGNPTTMLTIPPISRSQLPPIPATRVSNSSAFTTQSQSKETSVSQYQSRNVSQSASRNDVKTAITNIKTNKSNKLILWTIMIALIAISGAIATLIVSSSAKKFTTKSTSPVSQNIEGLETISLTENSSVQVSGQLSPTQIKRYNIEGNYGKGLAIKVLSGKISNISIVHPDGTSPPNLPNLAERGIYFFPYPGIFTITVKSNDETNFVLEIVSTEGKAPGRPPANRDRQSDRPPNSSKPPR